MRIGNYSDNTPVQISYGDGYIYRQVYYRIQPSELPLITRIFRNPWHPFRRAVNGTWDCYYSAEIYNKCISKIKTLGDVRKYFEEEYTIFRKYTECYGDQLWPDEKPCLTSRLE